MVRFFDIRFGTTAYPEPVARRLRTFNLTAWIAAATMAGFAVEQLSRPTPGVRMVGAVNGIAALVCAAMPLLHPLGQLVAPIAMMSFFYIYFAVVICMLGTATGMQNFYLVAAALGFLFFGVDRVVLGSLFGAAAAAFVIAIEVLVPRNAGIETDAALLYRGFIPGSIAACAIHLVIVSYALREAARAEAMAGREHARSESLLSNILPSQIAERLKAASGNVIADRHDAASVLFADLEGYTALAGKTAPDDLVVFLNRIFTEFDLLVERHGLEKIKTSGDCYMVVSGVPMPRPDHAAALARLALDLRDSAARMRDPLGSSVPVRIGIGSGAVVAGVVGTRKFFYDVWGDAVNVAQRMEASALPGKIRVAATTRDLLQHDFCLEDCGELEVKGKGRMRTWFLLGPNLAAGRTSGTAALGQPA